MKNNLLILFALLITTIGYSQSFTIDNITYYVLAGTDDVRINSYNGPGGDIIIPSTVTAGGNTYDVVQIDGVVFYQKQITSVVIPNSITSIGSLVFGDNQLTSITLPDNLLTLGHGAFQQNQLTDVTIPGSLVEISSGAFQANVITSLIIEEGVTIIDNFAFYNNQLQSITIPSSMTLMGNSVFDLNTLNTVISEGNPPATIETFSQDTFGSNRSAIDLTIPAGLTAVYTSAEWTGFNSVTQDFAVGDSYLVGNLYYEITSTTNNTATAIDYDMAGGTVLDIPTTIPNGLISYDVTAIGDNAFFNNQLTDLTLPNSITSIGSTAFQANDLETLTIPDSVLSMGEEAFHNNEITSLTIGAGITIISDGVFNSNLLTTITIPANVTTIGNESFRSNDLQTLIIPNTITSIGENAFSGNQLTSVTLSNNLTSISEEAFAGNLLTSVIIPQGITNIEAGAFGENSISTITFPDSVTNIGADAFIYNQLTTVVIPSSVTNIGGSAFQDNLLTDVYSESFVPPTIVTGSGDTFDDRSTINLHIPEGTTDVYVTDAGALWTGFNSVTEDAVLGAEDFELTNDVTVITTSEMLTVLNSANMHLKNYSLYNISGALIATGTESEIATSSMASGIYVLTLEFNTGTAIKKVIVQ